MFLRSPASRILNHVKLSCLFNFYAIATSESTEILPFLPTWRFGYVKVLKRVDFGVVQKASQGLGI